MRHDLRYAPKTEGQPVRRILSCLLAASVVSACLVGAGSAVGAPNTAAKAIAQPYYTETVSRAAKLITGTTDAGNHCGSYMNNDDACFTPLTFPFPVTLYGVSYKKAWVDSAGDLQFNQAKMNSFSDTGSCLPSTFYGPTIAVFGEYQAGTGPGYRHAGVFTKITGAAPHRTFTVERHMGRISETAEDTAADWHFEAQFTEGSPVIKMIYGDSLSEDDPADGGPTHDPANLWGTTGLQDGNGHSVGDCGSVPVDGVEITYTPSATKPQVTEESSPAIAYSSGWKLGTCRSTACSPDNKERAINAAGIATFTFHGSQARWIASTGPTEGKTEMYVDGKLKATVDLYSKRIVDGLPMYVTSGLTSGKHTIQLKRVSGRTNIDAFQVS